MLHQNDEPSGFEILWQTIILGVSKSLFILFILVCATLIVLSLADVHWVNELFTTKIFFEIPSAVNLLLLALGVSVVYLNKENHGLWLPLSLILFVILIGFVLQFIKRFSLESYETYIWILVMVALAIATYLPFARSSSESASGERETD
mgnify:CR=1 FL=1